MAIRFFFEEIPTVRSLKRKATKEIIRRILADFSFHEGDISFVFTTDKYLLKINRQFLNHDYLTDIITFPDYDGRTVNGDVYISTERVKENAVIFQTRFTDELMRVIIHGALHLCGVEDTSPALKKKMTVLEDRYLAISW